MIYLKTDDGISGPIPIERWTQLEFGGKLPRNAQRAESADGPWSPVFVGETMAETEARLEKEKAEKEQRRREDQEWREHQEREQRRNKINSRASMLAMLWVLPAMLGSIAAFIYNPFVGAGCMAFSLLVGWFIYNVARAAAATASKLDE